MKKLFPEAPDVPQGTANRVIRIIERHLRIHRVDRAADLPEEAKVRLFRDLRLFFDSDEGPVGRPRQRGESPIRRSLLRLWEKLGNVLSA